MIPTDPSPIDTLRSDLALQIARHVRREGVTQSEAARRLGIPQPTMSKIMRGRVDSVSLELLLRIAMRAGLAVVLQTGRNAAEAGVYVSGGPGSLPQRPRSRLGEEARRAVNESVRRMTPSQRLAAHLEHNELVAELHRFGTKRGRAAARKSR